MDTDESKNQVEKPNDAESQARKSKLKRDQRLKGQILLGLGLLCLVMTVFAGVIAIPTSSAPGNEVARAEKTGMFVGAAMVLTFAGLIQIKKSKED